MHFFHHSFCKFKRERSDQGIAKGRVKKSGAIKGGVSVCLRLSTFARVCLRFRLRVCLRLSAFVSVCLRLFAFARICLRPALLRPPLRDTEMRTFWGKSDFYWPWMVLAEQWQCSLYAPMSSLSRLLFLLCSFYFLCKRTGYKRTGPAFSDSHALPVLLIRVSVSLWWETDFFYHYWCWRVGAQYR